MQLFTPFKLQPPQYPIKQSKADLLCLLSCSSILEADPPSKRCWLPDAVAAAEGKSDGALPLCHTFTRPMIRCSVQREPSSTAVKEAQVAVVSL